MASHSRLLKYEFEFRNHCISQLYYQLKLDILLRELTTIADISNVLKLHPHALERFLNAAAYLQLVKKIDGKFMHATPSVHYDDHHAKLLLWLIDSGFADLIDQNTLTMNDVINRFGDVFTEKVKSSINCSLLCMEGDYIVNCHDISMYLLSSSSEYIGPRIHHYEKMFTANILAAALKTNESQWGSAYGFNVTNPFEIYIKDKNLLTEFMQGMRQVNVKENKELVKDLDLSAVSSVLDIGGGTGDWATSLLGKANPHCTVDIYERSDAIPVLIDIFKQNSDATTQNRIQYISGSFLDNPDSECLLNLDKNKQYDLISLCWILHDWNDQACALIIKKAYTHLVPGGRLIILEAILPEDKVSETALSDITMLLLTEGKERSITEYKDLLQNAGFNRENISWLKTSTRRQMMMARK